jgi:hypothetical protein
MSKLNLFKSIALALGCAALAVFTTSTQADPIKANAGTTFVLSPVPGHPEQLTHSIDGVVRVTIMGNSTFHGDVLIYLPTAPGKPYGLVGTCRFTSADGATTLDAAVEGIGTLDPANPNFLNIHYEVKFTGGTGQMANASGRGEIDGFGMFTSETTGKATWLLTGNVSTHGHGRGD